MGTRRPPLASRSIRSRSGTVAPARIIRAEVPRSLVLSGGSGGLRPARAELLQVGSGSGADRAQAASQASGRQSVSRVRPIHTASSASAGPSGRWNGPVMAPLC